MGHCKVKFSLCSVQQMCWGLDWGFLQGRAGGFWGLRCCWSVDISRWGGSTQERQRTERCQCVKCQPWVCRGAMQGQMQPLQCAAGVAGPVLGAAAGLGRWFVVVAVFFAGVWRFPEEEAALGNPQRTKPCQCVGSQPWACRGALQGQIQPLLCAAGLVGPAQGLRPGQAGGLWGVRFCWFVELSSRGGGSTRQPQRTEPC